jgi:hypothetical protein
MRRRLAGMRGYAFSRGDHVHAYWVERCIGFTAFDSRGRRLGRVRRVVPGPEATRLEIKGVKSRIVATTTVESIAPHDSLLVISYNGEAEDPVYSDRSDWRENTLPWFDIVASDGVRTARPPIGESKDARTHPRRARLHRAIRSQANRVSAAWTTFVETVKSATRAVQQRGAILRSWPVSAQRALRQTLSRLLRNLAAKLDVQPDDRRTRAAGGVSSARVTQGPPRD